MRKKRLSSAFESALKFVRNKKTSEDEIERFQKWIINGKDADEKNGALFVYWESLSVKPDKSAYHALSAVKDQLEMRHPVMKRRIIPLYTMMLKVAVVILPLVVIGTYFYYNHLSGGAGQSDVMTEIVVPRGAQQQTVLSDGTELWLNADSRAVFQQRSEKEERVVRLSGEAFFDVKRQENRLFVVETKYLSVRVLGTRFHIEAYAEDAYTKIALKSGKVEVKTEAGTGYVLEPGQQFVYDNKTKEVVVKQIGIQATDNISAWKSHKVYIESKTLGEILQILSRAYNVNFKIDDEMLQSDETYFANFTWGEDIELVMDVVSDMVGGLTYQINDSIIYVQKE